MSYYSNQVNRLWDEWIEETGQVSGDPGDFVDWAFASGRLAPRPEDVKQVLRKQVTQALRQSQRYDEEGRFTYRAKQSVTLFENGSAIKHYFDTDTGGTSTLRQKSVKQRREACAHTVYRAACDAERMAKMFPGDTPQLKFVLDFSDDVAELRIADSEEFDSDAA